MIRAVYCLFQGWLLHRSSESRQKLNGYFLSRKLQLIAGSGMKSSALQLGRSIWRPYQDYVDAALNAQRSKHCKWGELATRTSLTPIALRNRTPTSPWFINKYWWQGIQKGNFDAVFSDRHGDVCSGKVSCDHIPLPKCLQGFPQKGTRAMACWVLMHVALHPANLLWKWSLLGLWPHG